MPRATAPIMTPRTTTTQGNDGEDGLAEGLGRFAWSLGLLRRGALAAGLAAGRFEILRLFFGVGGLFWATSALALQSGDFTYTDNRTTVRITAYTGAAGAAMASQPARPQQATSPDQVPEGLAKSDGTSIRAADEAGRRAFQPTPTGWQARNSGQQWTTWGTPSAETSVAPTEGAVANGFWSSTVPLIFLRGMVSTD